MVSNDTQISDDDYDDDFSVDVNANSTTFNENNKETSSHSALHLKVEPNHNLATSSCALSERLVAEGEKYIKTAQKLEETKDEVKLLRRELDNLRDVLVNNIFRKNTGKESKLSDAYSHIPLEKLLRIYLQSDESTLSHNSMGSCESADTQQRRLENDDQCEILGDKFQQLQMKYSELKDQYDLIYCEKSEIEKLQKKIVHLVERSRYERGARVKAENKVDQTNKKLEALSDHIERLMVYLKHEASAKVRIVKDRIRAQREVELLRARDSIFTKKVASKDRLIEDLKKSVNILENQLHLMDEKYMELRLKLDWSRTFSDRSLKRKDEEIQKLNDQLILAQSQISKTKKVSNIIILSSNNFRRISIVTSQM